MLRYQHSNQNKGGDTMNCSCNELGSTNLKSSSSDTKIEQSGSDDCLQSLTEEVFMI